MSTRIARLTRLAVLVALSIGCGLLPAQIAPTATAVPPSATPTASPAPTETSAPTASPTTAPTPRPVISRVLIISVDGLRPDAIAIAPMPNLIGLMQSGAYSLVAQTIFPSVTLPSHTSMLTGLCPAQHGVNWNDYLPEKGYARGQSIFALAKQARMYTVMIVGKEKLRQISPPETTDVFRYINDRDVVIADQAGPILAEDFQLAFVHFPTTDDMGHEYGWLSDQQLSVIRRADEAIGKLLAALDQAGLRRDTLIIVTTDHGGHDTTHGSHLAEDMTIPWVVAGPGVVPQALSRPISTTDTAATAAWALKLPIPADWVGKPVSEAFGEAPTERSEPRCP